MTALAMIAHLLLGLFHALTPALVFAHIHALSGVSDHPLIVVIIVVLLFVFLLPRWGYNRGWSTQAYGGYGPSFGLGGLLLILLILWLLGII